MSLVFSKKYIFAGLSGATLSFTQSPFDFWWLIFPCFGIFYIVYAQTTHVKQAFIIGGLFGFSYHLIGLYWIGNALLVEGNDYKWAWPLAVVGLPLLLSLFNGIYTAISHIIASNKQSISGFLFLCSMLALSEWVRGYAFTGFPWNLYGYTWINVKEITQSVSLIGPYGLTFITILWGCSIGFVTQKNTIKWPIVIGILLSFIAIYEYGHFRLFYSTSGYDKTTQIHVVQPNIKQEDKWAIDKLASNFNTHIELSNIESFAPRNIIIWPETSIPPILLNNSSAQERIQTILTPNTTLLSGTLLKTKKGQYHNAITSWNYGRKTGQPLYSKSHLVPFGEYIPFQDIIPLKTVTNFSGFTKGDGYQTISNGALPSFLPLICYEIIFPQSAFKNKDKRPNYILTLTNDGWYGQSSGPYQHFTQARFRSIESGLPVIRAANTGISGFISPYGTVLHQTNLTEDNVISALLPQATAKKTYYSIYGDLWFLLLLLSTLMPIIILKYKEKR